MATASPPRVLRVALDWTPNVNHVGFYVARARGWLADAGLQLELLSPEASNYTLTPAKAVLSGAADFAVAPTETAIAYAAPQCAEGGAAAPAPQLVAVAALLQRDTSALAVLADSGIDTLAALNGRVYASYGARYEGGIVRAAVRAAGGTGSFTEVIPPRLDCWDQVLSRKADATWIFLPHEGVLAARAGVALRTWQVGEFGVPYGYSPVLLAPPALLQQRAQEVRALLAAVARGYAFAAAHPEEAAELLRTDAAHASLADAGFVRQSMQAAAGALLREGDGTWGAMEAGRWEAFLGFIQREGLQTARDGTPLPASALPSARDLFTNDYLPAPAPAAGAQ